jgi:hypothetical protein
MYSMKRYCVSHRKNAEIAQHAESLSKMFICELCGLPPPLDAYSSSFGEARRSADRREGGCVDRCGSTGSESVNTGY